MNRPEARNAQNLQMTYDLNAAFDQAVQDDAVKVIILAGNGPHFSSGHDLRPGGQEYRRRGFSAGRKLGWLRRTQRPRPLRARAGNLSADHTALAQSGKAHDRGGARQAHRRRPDAGLGLATIVASDDAEFCDPVVTMGVCGVEWFVHPWELGPRKAKELLFTADVWSAEEAHRLGMVNHVVPRDELSFVMKLAERIAAKPSFALKLTRKPSIARST